jgi:Metallo-peptidase family M12B Reprolysin-like
MPSIRSLASCIGLSDDFSILGDFFGFFRRQVPPDPTGAQTVVSLWRQAVRLQSDYHNLNVIAVGVDQFTDADDIEVDYSIYKLRNIWNQVGLGVGRIQHYGVDTADAGGLDSPTSRGDLEDITDRWTVSNDGIDMFIPHNMNVASNGGVLLGRSAVDGPCEDKDDKGMNGSTAGLWGSEQTARTFAHELGHYLTLKHRNSQPTNLMCQSSRASSTRNSVNLTSGQGSDMKDHCLVDSGC